MIKYNIYLWCNDLKTYVYQGYATTKYGRDRWLKKYGKEDAFYIAF